METKNAIIESTFLGMEDHGILTYFLQLNYGDSSSQGFGGYNCAIGDVLGASVKRILQICEVTQWEKLKGKIVRVQVEPGKMIQKIGHPLKEMWFDPSLNRFE